MPKHLKKDIPIHKLQERTSRGIEVRYFDSKNSDLRDTVEAHRDDHYIFLFQERGVTSFMFDFQHVKIDGSNLFYVQPGQVHQSGHVVNISGWFMAIDALLVGEEYRSVFENYVLAQVPIKPTAALEERLKQCFTLLFDFLNQDSPASFYKQVAQTLAASCIGMIAEAYLANEQQEQKQNSRAVFITRQFKSLLARNFKKIKSAAQYASELNISLNYLNEVVKDITGFNVSYWIRHEIMLEAKRLLYYSNLSIKEIAFLLGYEDHTYFSRLFTKATGISAGQFRKIHPE